MTYRGPSKPYVTTDADREREQRYWNARDKGGLPPPIPSSIMIKDGEGIDMTCRFELEFKGEQYPRSCPTCGLAGLCQKGYRQKRLNVGGYVLVDDTGKDNQGNLHADMQAPPQGLAGATGPWPAPIPEPKPVRVIDTERRLMLIGYLVGNNVKRNSVKEYDDMVDAIASILLD